MDDLNDLSDNRSMANVLERSAGGGHVVEAPQDLSEMLELARYLDNHESPAVLLGPDGEQVPLPLEVYELLREIVAAMEKGTSISIQPIEKRLTTQEAAEVLGVSRSTLVRMLNQNELPYERHGESRHRRLRLRDVLDYKSRISSDRERRLDEMTRQAFEDGLYDVGADTYREALVRARKEK